MQRRERVSGTFSQSTALSNLHHTSVGASARFLGAATTEILVGAMVLVPMFMLVVELAKMGDYQMKTAEASRFVAWERAAVGAKAHQLATPEEKINSWLFSRDIEPVKSEVTPPSIGNRKGLWDHRYKLGSMSQMAVYDASKGNLVVSEQNNEVQGSGPKNLMKAIKEINAIPEQISGKDLRVSYGGLLTARIDAQMSTAGLVDDKNCQNDGESLQCFHRQNMILTDTWAASGPQQVKSQVDALGVSHMLEPMAEAIEPIAKINVLNGLAFFGDGEFFEPSIGAYPVDLIPEDRLGPKNQ